MMFNILKNYHIMIGIPIIEMHQAVLPPAIAPLPKVPHLSGAALCMGPWGALTGLPNPTEISASGGIMLSQGTNIGPGIPHYNIIPPFPPNALLPLIIGLSGSKSHFGASSHKAPKGPLAFACLNYVSLNLNCAGPAWPPMPSGLVIAFNTHATGVTFGDFVGAILHMGLDMLIEFLVNRLFAGKKVSNFFEDIAERALKPLFRLTGFGSIQAMVQFGIPGLGRLGNYLGAVAEEFVFAIPGLIVAAGIVGSPVAYSTPWSGVGGNENWWQVGTWEDQAHGGAQRAVDEYMEGPEMGDFPLPGDPTMADDGTRTA